jgi:hypothetical protein
MYFGDDGATIDAATLEDHDPAWLRARRAIVATRRSVEALYVANEINRLQEIVRTAVGLVEMADAKMMRYFGVCVKLHAARSMLVQLGRKREP